MRKVLLILLVVMQGCATITYYIKKQYITPKNNKTYLLDTEVKNTYYLNNGEIRYKGRFLGSGRKMLDRIIEIEKELRGKE